MNLRHRLWIPAGAALLAFGCSGDPEPQPAEPAPQQAPAPAEQAPEVDPFTTVARVLRHPRCLNCHPAGDRPRVGDDARIHPQNVQRGPENHGMPGLHCATCHQPANQPLAGVPGAPHWGLAPRSMAWEGLDDHALAEALKDRAKNGDRSLEQLLEHVSHDALVLWGWDPGPGREAVPVAHDAFVAAFRAWIEGGAASPPAKQ